MVVAGYIGKSMTERSNCETCHSALTSSHIQYLDQSYFNLLSRGGLTKPSPNLADFVVSAFAILDEVDKDIMMHPTLAKKSSEIVLAKYCQKVSFTCEEHTGWGLKWAVRAIVNVFYNNKRKIVSDSVKVDQVKGFKKSKRTINH